MSRFDVDEIRSRLKKSSSSSGRSASDYLLWDEFKVAGFSRTLASLYVMCMLHALIKLQLSIVSRYVLFDQQAQQQRQEAEAAEQLQRGGQPAAPAAPDASGPPTFLPPAVCEEVNRVYFSLSRHAQSVGAAQLADHIASLVRQELAPWKALAGQVTRPELQAALQHIQDRVQSEALGLESKTEMEAQSGEPSEGSASAAGASAATTVYTSPNSATYVRFLLPTSAGLSALVGSTSFPDPHINNMASFRLAEMVAETNAVINSGAFQCALVASFVACQGEMERLLAPAFSPAAAARNQNQAAASSSSAAPADESTEAPIPFANVSAHAILHACPRSVSSFSCTSPSLAVGLPVSVCLCVQALVSTIKLFNVFLPDVPAGMSASAASSVASPLFHLLADLPAIKELCAVIYLPAEVLTQTPTAAGQPSALQQITANKQFGASSLATQQAVASAAQPPRLEIVDERSAATSASAASNGSNQAASHAQAATAARRSDDVKGLPVFDRL